VIHLTIEQMRRAWSSMPSPSCLLDRFLDQLEEFSSVLVQDQDGLSCGEEVPIEAKLRYVLGRHR
jgi:hypothetical protein